MNSSPTTTEEAWRKRPHEPESGSSTSQCGEETSPPPSRDRGDGGGAGTASMDEWRPSRHELLVIITLAVTNLLVALDASIVTTSLHAIATGVQANTTQAFWVGTSYLLTNAVVMPSWAAVSEVFGRPLCLQASLVLFTAGTGLCCGADGVGVLLAGRCVQGVGGGGIHVLGGVVMTDIVPLRHRPKWFGIVLAAWALGLCLGPVLGGLVAEKTTWRWVFYMMFPICGYGLVAVPALLTLRARTESLGAKLRRVDWAGGALFMGSATSVLVAVSWGGVQHAWDSAATVAPLVAGVVGTAATVVWERRFAAEPLFHRSIFRDASSVSVYVCAAIQGMLMWGLLYYLPFYFQSVKGFGPLSTGLSTLPALATVTLGAVLTGRLVTRLQAYLAFLRGGWAIAAGACALTVAWRTGGDDGAGAALWVPTYLLVGLGHGAVLNAGNFGSQAMCAAGDEAAAASAYLFLRQLGAAVGVGVGGSAFQNVLRARLAASLSADQLRRLRLPPPDVIAQRAEAFVHELLAMPDDDSGVKDRILDAYSAGFQAVFAFYLAAATVALVLSFVFVRHFPLDKELCSEHRLEANRVTRILDGVGVGAGKVGAESEKRSRGSASASPTPPHGMV